MVRHTQAKAGNDESTTAKYWESGGASLEKDRKSKAKTAANEPQKTADKLKTAPKKNAKKTDEESK